MSALALRPWPGLILGSLTAACLALLSACERGPAPTPTPAAPVAAVSSSATAPAGGATAPADRATAPAASAPAAAAAAAATAPPRLVVLALDAGTWDLLGPWMDQGLLPNLARLRAEGVHGKLRSTEPSSSPVIWTSIATGKVPAKTGIDWFVRFPHGPGKPVPVDRRQRKTKTLWNMLSERRIDVAVLGWYVTWPAEEVNGRLVSDLSHFGRLPYGTFPEQLLWNLPPVPEGDAVSAMKRFMDFDYDPARAVKKEGEPPSLDYLVFDRFVRAWTRDRWYLDAANRVLKDGPLPEAFFLYLRGTDDVQHGFWKFMDPAAFAPRVDSGGNPVPGTVEVPEDQAKAFGNVIQRYWQWIDEEIGRLLAHYRDAPPLVLVCSDHGAGPAVGEHAVEVPEYLHLSGAHQVDGIFLASGPGIRGGDAADGKGRTIEGASIYDIAPTILFALGLPVGRDMDGHVLTSIFDASVASRPDARVDTWDVASGAAAPEAEVPSEVDEKVLEQLRSLGYIGQ
jgi:predicted AlkP superfamily phosphohydrolase/phosphomutase